MDWITHILLFFDKYGIEGIAIILGSALICSIMYVVVKKFVSNIDSSLNSGMENLAIKITDNITAQNDRLIDKIQAQNDNLIDYIINSKKQEKEDHAEMLSERMNISCDINGMLKDIMLETHAHRVSVIEFHNSFQNLCGIPFAKYSCTYEWFKQGISALSKICKGLPFSSISSIVKDIFDKDDHQVIYGDIDNELKESNPILYSFFKEAHTHGMICNAMYDNKNTMIGLLLLEFPGEVPTHIDYNDLNTHTIQISSIINLKYKYS